MRNDIDARMLIENVLQIPCRRIEGYFRFLCPSCNEFDTAVNPNTNLARCFRCEQNFNTIDLVMLVRQTSFVQSVKFLQSIYLKNSVNQKRGDLEIISDPKSSSRVKLKTSTLKSDNGPSRIGQILNRVLSPEYDGTAGAHRTENKPDKSVEAHPKADEGRIAKVEQQLKFLSRQIDEIVQTIKLGPPTK